MAFMFFLYDNIFCVMEDKDFLRKNVQVDDTSQKVFKQKEQANTYYKENPSLKAK